MSMSANTGGMQVTVACYRLTPSARRALADGSIRTWPVWTQIVVELLAMSDHEIISEDNLAQAMAYLVNKYDRSPERLRAAIRCGEAGIRKAVTN
jgi:hypothetical protein